MNLQKTKKDSDISLMTLAIVIVIDILVFFLNGYTLMTIYNWYIPTTTTLSQISLATSIGIILIFSLLTKRFKQQDNSQLSEMISFAILSPIVLLGIAFVFKLILF